MSLAHFLETIYSSDGENARPAPEATVTVYDAGTTTEAAIYTSLAGTVSADNPVSADDDALVEFFVLPGRYDLVIATVAGTETRDGVILAGYDRLTVAAAESYSATLADYGDAIQFDLPSNGTVNLPENVSAGWIICAQNIGGGDVIFAPPSEETILNSVTTGAAFKTTAAQKCTATEWLLIGDVS